MILLRAFVQALNERNAMELASEYILLLSEVCEFKQRVVQPYWKIKGQYEILLESEVITSESEVIGKFLIFHDSNEVYASSSEVIVDSPGDNYFLPNARWVHLEIY